MRFNLNDISHELCLTNLWHQQFSPIISLLADISELSLPQVLQALPHLLKIANLQINRKINCPNSPNFFNDINEGNSSSLPLATLVNNVSQFGMGFTQIPSMNTLIPTLREKIFDDVLHYHRVLGVLSDRTALVLVRAQKLLDWIILLCLMSLHQLTVTLSTSVAQIRDWLKIQPYLGFDNQDEGLLMLYQQRFFRKLPSDIKTAYLTQTALIRGIFNDPKILSVFSFAAFVPVRVFSNVVLPTRQDIITTTTPSIFIAARPKSSLMIYLQKYWIATSILLTTITFGIISLFISMLAENKSATNTVNPVAQPIHDIAILKLDSSSTTTVTHLPKMQLRNTNKDTSTKIIKEKSKTSLEKIKMNEANTKKDNHKSTKSAIKTDDKSKLNKVNDKNLKNKKPA